MTAKVNYKPDGYHTVTPFIVTREAARQIDFIEQVLAGKVISRTNRADGSIMHSEVQVGDSVIMLADGGPNDRLFPAMLHLYVENCDLVYQRALGDGATSLREPADQFYGDRICGVADPFGNQWWFATHIEDVSQEEMQRRLAAMSPQ